MKFSHQYIIPAAPEIVWKISYDEAFTQESYAKSNATHTLLSSEQKDGKTVNRVQVLFNDPLPAIASKMLGMSNLQYEQIEIIDNVNHRYDWQIIVPKISNKVKSEGYVQLIEHEGQSKRIVEGLVEVKIPFIGGKAEKHIAQKFETAQREISLLLIERIQNNQ